MILTAAPFVAAALLATPVATAQPSDVESGLTTALAACRQWVLEPTTWIDGVVDFPERAGLAGRIRSQATVPVAALPPPEARRANHYWHVPVSSGGLYVTVSDAMPICHIAGGGAQDWQPSVEALVAAPAFTAQWVFERSEVRDGIRTTTYKNRNVSRLGLTLSRAAASGGRTDRLQIIATAVYEPGN